MSLKFEIDSPSTPGAESPVIVLLHGRGSDRFDLLGLRRGLPAESTIVTPEAPFPAAPWGYGPGWAWYQYVGEDRPEAETFSESQRLLAEFIADLPNKLPAAGGPVILGGFSQGGTMSLAHALINPRSVAGVLNFSGFLANHPAVEVTQESVRGTPIFWGHGTADPAIPFTMAEAGRAKLRSVGADLVALDYRMGHSIDAAELAAASEWLGRVIGPAGPDTTGESK
jgi:phospholipase/carboxylesterase